ncbi:MAG TPA: diacylglycerol kinase family protein [Actinomycetota bacterium]|nr:diacylglycerol kinase family protein [Actinomycetota bacterium]
MTSPFGPLTVIADPAAGGGRVGERLPALERALEAIGLEHSVVRAERRGEGARLAAEALDAGRRFVVAVGDDASVQDVVNGMFREGAPIVGSPVLGVVAAGAENDLLRSFGLPGDVDGGVQHLLGESTYPFDLMRITCTGSDGVARTRYAHNMAEIGLGAGARIVSRRLPGWLGDRPRRFLGFWKGYVGTRRQTIRVGHDMKTWHGECFHVVIGNGQFTGGVRLSPRSFPGDGVLDALVFTGQKSDAYTMIPRMMRHGGHVPDGAIKELRAKIRFSVDSERPMPVVADGEPLGVTPVTVQVVPQQILLKL